MNTHTRVRYTAASVAALNLALAAQMASAQAVPPPAETPAQEESAGDSGDIVVTARQREERLIDVPVSVTALTKDEIAKYQSDSVQKIAEIVPGLVVSSTYGLGGGSISIRGISTAATATGFEQPVSIVVDGVPINSAWITSAGFFDLGQAEVLKGPQTLLFGKNNTAGVIALHAAEPTDTFQGSINGSYEFVGDEATIDGMISGPLTDTLKGRIAVRYRNLVGWMYNDAHAVANPINPAFPFAEPPDRLRRLGEHEILGRVSLTWEPSTDFTSKLKVTVDSRRNDGPGVGNQVVGGCLNNKPRVYNFVDPFGECTPDNHTTQGQLAPGLVQYYNGGDVGDGTDKGAFDAVLASSNNELKLGKFSLTSTTGYTRWQNFSYGNFDETSFPQLVTFTPMTYAIFSQELRLLSNWDSPFNFMVGGFYQDFDLDPYRSYVKLRDDTNLNLAAGTLVAYDKRGYQHNKTYSGFAQLIIKPIDEIEIAGGARYTKETKDSLVTNFASGQASFPGGKTIAAHYSDDNISPELTVAYHPNNNSTIFAGYRTGYKSGGFALSSTITSAATVGDFDFESEKVKGYEAGAKSILLNGKLRLDLTAYHYKFTNLQVNTYNPATISYTLANAGALKQTGVDFLAYLDITRGFQLRGAANWNRNRFGSFFGQCYSGQTAAQGCNILPGPSQDFTGRPSARSPDWSGNGGFTYNSHLGDSFDVSVNGDAYYTGSYFASETLAPGSHQGSFWRLNAGINLTNKDGWTIGLVGKNLTNRYYIVVAEDKTGQAGEQRGTVARGREIAVQAGFKF